MKVVLTTLNAKYVHASLALRYLEKYCRQEVAEMIVQEYTINHTLESITASLYKTKADVFAFSCYIWNVGMTLEIAQRLKMVNPKCLIILGGPEVSYDADNILQKHAFIDYIILGEGEQTLQQLLGYIRDKKQDLSDVLGVAWRQADKVLVNNRRQEIETLDCIPSPYTEEDLKKLSDKFIYYETSRGCPFNCSYCLSSTIEGVRYFSMKRVKEDFLMLINANVRLVKFVDRTFNADKQRAMEIFTFLVAHRKNTSFHFEIAADLLDEEMIAYLKQVPVGLFQFEIGVQSINPHTIEAITRKMVFDKVAKNVESLRSAGNIHLHLDLIAGLPYEDYASFAHSFDAVYALQPHALQLGFLKMLKGSNIRAKAAKHQYIFTNIPPYEVLQNQWLSYGEMIKIKGIEDVVEKYHNKGGFEKSLAYITSYFYSSPFSFFETLATYFEREGISEVSHSQKALYDILFKFYCDCIMGQGTKIFVQYLKFDWVCKHKNTTLPNWAPILAETLFKEKCFSFLKDEDNIKQYLPRYKGEAAKKIIKQVHFEIFDIGILAPLEKNPKEVKTVILFDNKTENVWDVTKKFFSF